MRSRWRSTDSHQQARKAAELLEGFSVILRDSLPQRLFEALQRLDQNGVYEPLRYDLPVGPEYVADAADELIDVLRGQLEGDV